MSNNKINLRIKGDKVIWIVYLLFMLISLVLVFSSMGKTVYENRGGNIFGMFIKHFFLLTAGFLATYISHLINYKYYSKYSNIMYGGSVLLLAITLFIGEIFGKAASRWIVLPFIGQFQPSEIVKYLLIIYVANRLSTLKEGIKDRKNFLILTGQIAFVAILIFPENFSTAFLLFCCCFVMLFIAGAKIKHMLSVIGLGAAVLFAVFIVHEINPEIIERSGTWVNRIDSFINNDKTEYNQPNIATMAIATGGILGKGIGNTEQGRFLSESHNDFIFAIILEEGGLLLGVAIIILYIILFYRAIKISRNALGLFGSYLAIGIGLIIILQAMINIMVATTLIPVTGQTLPFISYGGTSLLFSSVGLGLLLSIDARSNKSKIELEKKITDSEKKITDSEKNETVTESDKEDINTNRNESNN